MAENGTERQQRLKAPVLNRMDDVVVVVCWAGAAAVAYLSANALVAVISIAAAYYLAKWVILKGEN